MNRFFKKHKDLFIILIIIFTWRLFLLILQMLAFQYPQRIGYLGFIPEANFDGVFYLNISEYWYRGLDQAFFPVYPTVMKGITTLLSTQPAASGIIVSISSLIILLISFKKLVQIDFKKSWIWVILFLLLFPTSFFFANIYTESLFLLTTILSFYSARKKNIWLSSLFGAIATGTRIIGIFLLPALLYEVYNQLRDEKKKVTIKAYIKKAYPYVFLPFGLVAYMSFLFYKYADPLLFVHIQPAFGAGRSGGEIILLPQVFYRYIKILVTVPPTSLTFFISFLELFIFFVTLLIIYLAFRKKIRRSYILFSLFAILFPTLSGTLSSIPRYALGAFVIFMYLGTIKNKYIKIFLLGVGITLQAILALFFLRGYFVS